jgi:glycosyltransferase involved in cell wall biosynthesis
MIEILLSTYNGEKYLSDLIESLLNQTYQDLKIIIRDDGSVDNTCSIIESFYDKYPSKISFIKDSKGNIGSTGSFSVLLSSTKGKYIMFCDQDDIWLPNKVSITLNTMEKLQKDYPGKPLLVYTDLIEVNENCEIISNSFIKSHLLYPEKIKNVPAMLAMSVVAGCTIMINDDAIKYILPIPSNLVHDHWIATNIFHYGHCEYLNEKTILYRQHGNNSVGAKNVNFSYLMQRFSKLFSLCKFFYLEIKSYPFKINILYFIFYKIKFNVFRIIRLHNKEI